MFFPWKRGVKTSKCQNLVSCHPDLPTSFRYWDHIELRILVSALHTTVIDKTDLY